MNLKVKEKIKKGVYLIKPYGMYFLNDKITAFVKPIKENFKNKLLYVCEGNKTYGILLIKNTKEINTKEFKKLYKNHKIPEFYRRIWWGKSKHLYYYEFESVEKFENPIKYEYAGGSHNFISDVTLSEVEGNAFT